MLFFVTRTSNDFYVSTVFEKKIHSFYKILICLYRYLKIFHIYYKLDQKLKKKF